jgi:CheY-like chemotaxis protein
MNPHVTRPPPSLLQGKRVLLAEDNLINQTVAKKMLTQLGMVAVVAANGAEAVDAVTSPGSHFDVVLMDMAMPVMGGVSATKVLVETHIHISDTRENSKLACLPQLVACLRSAVQSYSNPHTGLPAVHHVRCRSTCHSGAPSKCSRCRAFADLAVAVAVPQNIRGRGLEVPIVAMTANASDKDRDECLDAGMDGFLSKPVLKDRLAEVGF